MVEHCVLKFKLYTGATTENSMLAIYYLLLIISPLLHHHPDLPLCKNFMSQCHSRAPHRDSVRGMGLKKLPKLESACMHCSCRRLQSSKFVDQPFSKSLPAIPTASALTQGPNRSSSV